MAKSSIEWTEVTWNPTTGCTKISEGCKNCYAEILTKRLKAMGLEKYKNGFKIAMHDNALLFPETIKKPSMIFVNSMSDLFHDGVSDEFIIKTFKIMNKIDRHIYQVLTKRPERVLALNKKLKRTKNIWMGTSVENQKVIDRISVLSKTGAKIKFISAEPLLGNLNNIPLDNIDWVIVGGESGPKSRPIKEERVLNIKEQCRKNSVAFFFKQWGGKQKKKAGRLLNGEIYNEYPLGILHFSFIKDII